MLSDKALRLVKDRLDMPSLFIMGAVEGSLWLSDLVEVKEAEQGDSRAVIALMRSEDGTAYIDVVCEPSCPPDVVDVVRDYVIKEGQAFIATSRPDLVDYVVLSDPRTYLASQTAFLSMYVDGKYLRPSRQGPPEVTISVLDEHDLEDAEDLLSEWSEEAARRSRDLVMRGTALGAWHQGRLVGIIGTYATTESWWYLGSLYVREEYRGRGIGTALAALASREALRSAGAAVATVEVYNVTSRGLLARLGYRAASVSTLSLLQYRG